MTHAPTTRRDFLDKAAAAGAGVLAAGFGPPEKKGKKAEKEDEDVSPAEDLMREHGVLKRVLLVYGEAIRRLDASEDLPPEPVADAAKVIRSFIEDYHEKLEEDFLFPRFRKAGKLVDLVDVLFAQHRAGRGLTETTIRLSIAASIKDPEKRQELKDSMAGFIRMYAPHEAREDTVLFPAFRTVVTANEYDALGDDFEKKEHQLFGSDGFEKIVDRVAGIEKKLGIYDLAAFTPKARTTR